MRFWVREIAGWLLVLIGLFVFWVSLSMLLANPPRLLEVGPTIFIGFIVFRGGIHLLKVAMAARVCLHAQAEMAAPGPRPRDTRVVPSRGPGFRS